MRFKFDYWYTHVGFIGASRTGKSHACEQLARVAGGRSSALCAYADQAAKYRQITKDVVYQRKSTFTGGDVDAFLSARQSKRYWLMILDDLDIYVKSVNASRQLADLPIAAKGHQKHGCLFQARRTTNLPYTLMQNSTYMVFTYGVSKHDYDDMAKYLDLDLDLYKRVKAPVKDAHDPSILTSCEYLVLDVETKEQEIFGGFA